MTRVLIPALLLSAAAVAAPVPKESKAERMTRLFGKPVDPDQDCRFELDGEKLRVPAEPHVLVTDRGLGNAPRVVRTVAGDFTARVKVRLVRPADQKVGGAGGPTFQAGLVVMHDRSNFVYVGSQSDRENGVVRPGGAHGKSIDGGNMTSGSSYGDVFKAHVIHWQLTRTGDSIRPAFSLNGVDWFEMELWEHWIDYPARVAVGVFVGHNSSTPFLAEFEDFTVTPAKPGK